MIWIATAAAPDYATTVSGPSSTVGTSKVVEVHLGDPLRELDVASVVIRSAADTVENDVAWGREIHGLWFDTPRPEQSAVFVAHRAGPEREIQDNVGACPDQLDEPTTKIVLDLLVHVV